MKILIAEDSLTQATLMKHGLQRIGYEVILARDGIEAIMVSMVARSVWALCGRTETAPSPRNPSSPRSGQK